jgi:hypothetical protein
MIKIVLIFAVVFFVVFFGIDLLRRLTGAEKWQLTKMLGYATLCSVITLAALSAIVLLF